MRKNSDFDHFFYALVRTQCKENDVEALFSRFPQELDEISYEDARSLVLGAVDYTRSFGFEPHPDWAVARGIVESERPFERKFTFGKDGMPFYIQGPHDDTMTIMSKLSPLIREGKAHFLAMSGAGSFEMEDSLDIVETLSRE